MSETIRRTLLAAGAASAASALAARHAPGASAAERIGVGIIGPGGHGTGLLRAMLTHADVDVIWVCDPDARRMGEAAKIVQDARGKPPRADRDLRRVLEDPAVDAVVVATPDHWHAPATILACQAGKHVYVEKPCAHNVREGRLMVEAARRYNRVVQVGTQSRSGEAVTEAMKLLRDGAIGDVLVAKAWNSQLRGNIGKSKAEKPPDWLDYDLWVGPAPMVPYRPNMLPSIWRWWRAFGTGDIGNDGVHDIDIARWGLGVTTHPSRIASLGGKFFFDDDQQFPDTQYVVYEYDIAGGAKRQLVFEQRIWSPYFQEGYENGNAFYGTKGMLILGKQLGWKLYGPRNELRREMRGGIDVARHQRNFLDCIKSGARPNADIEIGHLSAALSHLGNIATTVERVLRFDPAREHMVGDPEADRMLSRTYRRGHWAIPKGV